MRYVDALARLAEALEANGDHVEAIRWAEQLVRQDPVREESYRLLMRLHATRGDRARALRVFHACAATLERELGIEASVESREIYQTLLATGQQPATVGGRPETIGDHAFVGRVTERTELVRLWKAAEQGHARFVLVSGEPGIGKSRLLEELRAFCSRRGAVIAQARSFPAEGALAYGPVVEWLRSEGIAHRLERIDRARLSELARILPELLSEVPGLPVPDQLPEGDRRQRLFDAIARAISTTAAPLLLIADDLHWCDRETLQFMHYLIRMAQDVCLMVVGTARREEIDADHPLNDLLAGLYALDRCTEIRLDRLGLTETAALAERISARPIDESLAGRLHAETEGNPLFVVEALRAGWRPGGEEPAKLTPRVQAAIESRLAQLTGPAHELAGLAATIGREFTTDILIAASDATEETVVRGLDELWRRRIAREQGADAYDFSHDKIREVAYLGLSPARRRYAHLRVARALEQRHAHNPGAVSGLLAAHYERAGYVDDAMIWYRRAADVALHMYANVEAVRLLDRALALLRAQPDSPRRATRELALLTALAAPLGAVEGYSSDRLIAALERALSLAQSLAIDPDPPLLRSLAIAHLARREVAAARALGGQLHARGSRDADNLSLVEAYYVLGIAAFWQGEFAIAEEHFQAAVARYRPEYREAHLLRYGMDPKVICLSRLGNTLWFLGRPDAAVRARDAALALADEIGHPFSRSTALVFAATLALDMRDAGCARAYAARLEAGLPGDTTRPSRFSAQTLLGFVEVLDGRPGAGIARIQRTLEESRDTDHAPGMGAHIVRTLLEACRMAGDARTGLQAADSALASLDAVRLWEAEIRRLRAEFLLALGAPADDVSAELDRAFEVARRQGAISLQLRVAMDVLRVTQDRCPDPAALPARARLAAVVAAFPEDRDSPELHDAIMLLERS